MEIVLFVSLLQQYLFSRKATDFLVSLFKDLSFKNVLCLGTPRYIYVLTCRIILKVFNVKDPNNVYGIYAYVPTYIYKLIDCKLEREELTWCCRIGSVEAFGTYCMVQVWRDTSIGALNVCLFIVLWS